MSIIVVAGRDDRLYVLDVDEPVPDRCSITAWNPRVAGVAEVFHAHIVDWGYPAHSHETWTVLIVDHGAIAYSLDKKRCAAVEATIAILPPGVVHDGRPASRARRGFWKRVLYLDTDLIPMSLTGPAVDRTTMVDPELRSAISDLHDALRRGGEPLDAEARLALICERLGQRLRPTETPLVESGCAHRLRELLDEHTAEPCTLADAAARLDRTVPHLVRSFTTAFGISPHAYVIGRRVDVARSMLLRGVPTSQVAAEAGFCDQAHLTRHFKRHTSTTPACYARSGQASERAIAGACA